MLMEGLYRHHHIQTPILGTRESIREITPELLELCHRAFYTPKNMILCVVGDVAPETVTRIAEERLGTVTKSVAKKIPCEKEDMTSLTPIRQARMEVAMPTFQLGFKCEPVGSGEDAIRREVVGDLASEALFGESSELYLKLYEQGDIDSSFGGGFETVDGCAMLTCGGDSERPEAVRDAIIAQAEKLAAQGVDEAAFLRMKRSAMGRRIRDLDSFDSTCFRLCAYFFSDFDYFEFPKVYESVTVREVQEFLGRVVRRERCGLSVIEPIEGGM